MTTPGTTSTEAPRASATPLSQNLEKVQKAAFAVGAVASAVLLIGAFVDTDAFFRAYLVAFLYWIGPSLGALALIMIHNMTGGAWGFAIRRLLEAAVRNVPLTALFFLPILLFGVHHLYEWSHADVVAADPVLQHKSLYLNRTFFTVRAVVYFAVWIGFARALTRLSTRYDRTLDISSLRRLKNLSGVGLGIYVLTMSFAAFDWGMSLEPHWFSTIYGLLLAIGQVLTALCFVVFVASRIARHEPFSRWIARSHFHDLGNLIMAFVMLWAYVSLSQFLIIWSGNLPEETPWYLHRIGHGWQAIAVFLCFFHFALPFVILLNRRVKRNMDVLAKLAVAILVVHFVEKFWLIAPAFHSVHEHGMSISYLDVAAPIALGGIWVGSFVRNLRGRPLVSLQDARLLGSLEEGTAAEA